MTDRPRMRLPEAWGQMKEIAEGLDLLTEKAKGHPKGFTLSTDIVALTQLKLQALGVGALLDIAGSLGAMADAVIGDVEPEEEPSDAG